MLDAGRVKPVPVRRIPVPFGAASRPTASRPDTGRALLGGLAGSVVWWPRGSASATRHPTSPPRWSRPKAVSLDSLLADRPVLLCFYTNDFSPDCIHEWCSFRDYQWFSTSEQVRVVGISKSRPSTHRRFIDYLDLTFPLFSGADLLVTEAFGVKYRTFEFFPGRARASSSTRTGPCATGGSEPPLSTRRGTSRTPTRSTRRSARRSANPRWRRSGCRGRCSTVNSVMICAGLGRPPGLSGCHYTMSAPGWRSTIRRSVRGVLGCY